jgi:hypothetical protein
MGSIFRAVVVTFPSTKQKTKLKNSMLKTTNLRTKDFSLLSQAGWKKYLLNWLEAYFELGKTRRNHPGRCELKKCGEVMGR